MVGLARPSIRQLAQVLADGWILGTSPRMTGPSLPPALAGVEPLLDRHAAAARVTQLLVEREHGLVAGAHQQVGLPHAALAHPAFRHSDDLPPEAAAALRRLDADVIHGAAMPVVPDHDAGDDALVQQPDQH